MTTAPTLAHKTAPKTMSTQAATAILGDLGWRVTGPKRFTQALENFQRGWNLGPKLEIDGILGPKTSAALEISAARQKAGKHTASAHFSFVSFRCHCQQEHFSCEGIRVLRPLLVSLEKLRLAYGTTTLRVVSGYRCPDHNKAIGGSSKSQHLFGGAADVNQVLKTSRVVALKAFAGIGTNPANGRVDHVDRRDRSGHNFTNSTPTHPVTFVDKPQ